LRFRPQAAWGQALGITPVGPGPAR
jgi:hypothetical protein